MSAVPTVLESTELKPAPRKRPRPDPLLADAPLKLELRCTACGFTGKYGLFEVCYATGEARQYVRKTMTVPDNWDGFYTPRIIECRRCGSEDTYELTGNAYMLLTGRVLANVLGRKEADPVIFLGTPTLWDGTVPRRPSEGILRLRELAEANPKNGEAWRRLGNFCERSGRIEEAVVHWMKAVNVDEHEVEAAYSLAIRADVDGATKHAARFAEIALCRLPHGSLPEESREVMVNQLARVLLETAAPGRVLGALWEAPSPGPNGSKVVNLSSARLDRVSDPSRLAWFFLDAPLVGVTFLNEASDDFEETTRLEWLLVDEPPGSLELYEPDRRPDLREARKRRKRERQASKAARKKQRRN